MRQKTIYIAGPMRGYPEYNYPRFHRWAAALRRDGWTVLNPAEMSEAYGPPEMLAQKPRMLQKVMADEVHAVQYFADALFLLAGWETSAGAREELKCFLIAHGPHERENYPIYTEVNNLPPVLKSGSEEGSEQSKGDANDESNV